MKGTPISVVRSVSTSTANWMRPPPLRGIRTSVIPKTSSVSRSTRAFGNAARI
jgi:hypothetical protein